MKEIFIEKSRIVWIDTCKGIGIILVVLGHLVQGYKKAGIFSDYLSILDRIDCIIYAFHMILFFILSGYTFYIAYCKSYERRKSYFKQIVNLIWIFSLFSLLLWGIKWIGYSCFHLKVNDIYDMRDLLWIWIKPRTLYWYIWCLIFYYTVFYIIIMKLNWHVRYVFTVTMVLSLFATFLPMTNDETPRNLLYFSFHFFLGICAAKYNLFLKLRKKAMFLILGISVSAIIYVLITGKSLLEKNKWYINTGGGIPQVFVLLLV